MSVVHSIFLRLRLQILVDKDIVFNVLEQSSKRNRFLLWNKGLIYSKEPPGVG